MKVRHVLIALGLALFALLIPATSSALADSYVNFSDAPVCLAHASNAPNGSTWRAPGYIQYTSYDSTHWLIKKVYWFDSGTGSMYASAYAYMDIYVLSTNGSTWTCPSSAYLHTCKAIDDVTSYLYDQSPWKWLPSGGLVVPKYRTVNGVRVKAVRLWYYQDLHSVFGRTTWNGYFGGDGHLHYLPTS